MKIATWNVNSIAARLPHVTRWLATAQPDVLCIQESKCADEKFPLLELKAAGYDCAIFGQQSYNGVAIFPPRTCGKLVGGYPGDRASGHARLVAAEIAALPASIDY